MNTLEKNKLIAEFMGLVKIDESFTSGRSIEFKKGMFADYEAVGNGFLKYDSDWNLLMAVFCKCTSFGRMYDYETVESEVFEEVFYMDTTFSNFLDGDIQAIFERCVKFITWYNQRQKSLSL